MVRRRGRLKRQWGLSLSTVESRTVFHTPRVVGGKGTIASPNMGEWAFSPFETLSSVAGSTRNPYDLNRVPAGSSGGTAAAVAANLATAGLGTDTGNSIRGPASHCCLVGLRSTMGLTSRDGIIPLYLRNDIGGPMTRTVEDTARILDVIVGYDPEDPITQKGQEKILVFYRSSGYGDRFWFRNPNLYVTYQPFPCAERRRNGFNSAYVGVSSVYCIDS